MTARTLFVLSLLGFSLTLLYAWWTLPEQVPVHFGIRGGADRVVGRDRAVLEGALVGFGTAALLAGTAELASRVPLSMINVPHRDDYWARPENEPVLRRLVAGHAYVIAAMTMALLAAVELTIVAVADDPEPRLGWGTAMMVVGYLVAVAVYLVAAHRSYRPPNRG